MRIDGVDPISEVRSAPERSSETKQPDRTIATDAIDSLPRDREQIRPSVKLESSTVVFAVDSSQRVVFKIVDDKGEVIRQVPPEEMLHVSEIIAERLKIAHGESHPDETEKE